jgi:hypothetical protein
MARVFGAQPQYVARTADGFEVFPARGMFGAKGVGIRPSDRAAVYFWTRRREDVLAALAAHGFTVTWAEQRFRY